MSATENMNTIWMYWENTGKTTPKYIDLCIKTVDKHKGNLKLNVLDQNTITQYLPDLRPEWQQLKRLAHKADYIRTRLTYKYGGMWLDCDMAALAPLEPLFDFPESLDYACQNIGTSIGCFVARPSCRLLGQVIAAQDQILDDNLSGFKWNGIGNELLTKFSADYDYFKWQEWTLDEIAGGQTSKLLSRHETIEGNVDKNAIIFHFCNEVTGPLIKKYLHDDRLLSSNYLISKIFRKALQIEDKHKPGFGFYPSEFYYELIMAIKNHVKF
ncbi:MAG: capsular polysaccharide synthesis protein [Methylococcaceae bacterium]|jgi:hypothetical protein